MTAHSLGLSSISSLNAIARHEAGHFLLNWLMEREPGAIIIMEGGGATVDAFPQNEYPHQRLLRTLAGIVFSDDSAALDELAEYGATPDVFEPTTDSYLVSKAALMLAEQWKRPVDEILAGFTEVLDEIRLQYGEAVTDIARELIERRVIPQQDCKALYSELDKRFGFDKRPPKSDIVLRMLARQFGWRVPQKKVLGWNFMPIGGWDYGDDNLPGVQEEDQRDGVQLPALRVRPDTEEGG